MAPLADNPPRVPTFLIGAGPGVRKQTITLAEGPRNKADDVRSSDRTGPAQLFTPPDGGFFTSLVDGGTRKTELVVNRGTPPQTADFLLSEVNGGTLWSKSKK